MTNYFKGNVLITLCFTFIPFNFFSLFLHGRVQLEYLHAELNAPSQFKASPQ